MSRLFMTLCLLSSFLSIAAQQKKVLLWFDATANFSRLSVKDSVVYYLQRSKECGVTDVVIDVKPITGEVLYPSKIAPQMKEWNGFVKTENFDLLTVVIEEAHRLGMKVHASMNIFVAGHIHFNRGVVYTQHPEWQSINYTDTGMVPISQIKTKYSAMLNPANPEVRKYELSIIKELVKMYPAMDGIILDRGRYDGIGADFSLLSKQLFEKHIGHSVQNFPSDIYSYKNENGKSVRVPGKLYRQWLEWRAKVIYEFFADARKTAKSANKKIIFGDYTGAWYPTYYEVGVNWASKQFDPSQKYEWATSAYKNYGYAELLDLFTVGCYFYEVTKSEVEKLNESKVASSEAGLHTAKEDWFSVEGSAELVSHVTKGVVPVYAGIYVDQYKDAKDQLQKAMVMCMKKSDGLMVFDIVHLIQKRYFDVLKNAVTEGNK